MSESRFDTALDAVVSGKSLPHPDEFTRFAADLIRNEGSIAMPSTLKRDLGSRLSLTLSPIALKSPGSRRRHVPSTRTERRPWLIAVTIVAAIAVALTGVMQWGIQPDRTDNRFGMLSPAVPTAEATPIATETYTSIEPTMAQLEQIFPRVVSEVTCGDQMTSTPDFRVSARATVELRSGPGIDSGEIVAAIAPNEPLQYLCAFREATHSDTDQSNSDDLWLKFRTEDGAVGWLRQVDVAPGENLPTPTVAPTTQPGIEELQAFAESTRATITLGGDARTTPTPAPFFIEPAPTEAE